MNDTPILAVAQRGEPILTLTASPVIASEFNTTWLYNLIDAMQNTMQERQGVGIAAPQVYISKRIIIVASRPNLRYPDAPDMPAVAMMNPEIIQASADTLLGEEGCLSVPDQRGTVPRAAHIQVHYYDVTGQPHTQDFAGFPARIVQHEIDHLNGVLFVDRL